MVGQVGLRRRAPGLLPAGRGPRARPPPPPAAAPAPAPAAAGGAGAGRGAGAASGSGRRPGAAPRRRRGDGVGCRGIPFFSSQWYYNDPEFDSMTPSEKKKRFPGWVNPARKRPHWFSRVCACAVMSIPILDIWSFSIYLFHEYPLFEGLNDLVIGPNTIYNYTPDMPLIIFFALFTLVIRNRKIPHFVRYHTMLSLMFDIFALTFTIMSSSLKGGVWVTSFMREFGCCIAFISTCVPCVLAMWYTARGFYVEMPFWSDASYVQVTLSEMD